MKVSLFPFLPVLLCMMGAMIMLLVLVAWNVREQAVHWTEERTAHALTAEEAEELRKKIETQIEDIEWYTENFITARQNALAELAEHQARLALAERETQKIRDELDRLEQLARQLASQTSATPDPEEVEQIKRLLAQQQQRRAEAELELAELQKEAAQKEKSYAILPARRPNGTFRRPIYIECREDKIILQPEGVELVPGDFVALERPDNPLNTVLRVIRQYYLETEQIVRGSEPYPLLIVRPSGVDMFFNARQAMGEWIEDFGYEIVMADWNIQYPEPDNELHRRITQQLDISRNRLSGYMVARRMMEPSPGGNLEYGNSGHSNPGGNNSPGHANPRYSSNAPQRFRMDHRGNIVPVGDESSEELQRRLAASRQAAEQQSGGNASASGQEQSQHSTAVTAHQRTEPAATNGHGEPVPSSRSNSSSPTRTPPAREAVAEEQPLQSPTPQIHNPPQRPKDWALQGVTQFSSGISRTVRIRCEADRLVLVAQAGLRGEQAFPISGSVASAADQLVLAIWEFQHSWGSAGENMHWKPILQVRVSLGGEQRIQELKNHLRNSGLVIEE
jgi:hypothetical protein